MFRGEGRAFSTDAVARARGIAGVGQQVDQDLQDRVPVDHHVDGRLVVADELQRFIEAVGGSQALEDRAGLGFEGVIIQDLTWTDPQHTETPFVAWAGLDGRVLYAEKANLELHREHLAVIEFLRESYRRDKRHPVIRMVTSNLAHSFAKEKGTVKYFHTLFPGGIHQAFLVAGLPMQDSCC